MSGPQLAERVRTLRPDIKVLFMSGYTDEAIIQHGILDSGVTFLQKPITPETLAQRFAKRLGRSKRGDAQDASVAARCMFMQGGR